MQSIFDPEFVGPMREELTRVGFRPLLTPEDVDDAMSNPTDPSDKEGTVLVFFNSVCGCAAGMARPALALALQNEVIPDRLVTVFAGVDREATQRMRDYLSHGSAGKEMPPSSPSAALLKDGEIIYMLQRKQIESRDIDEIALDLKRAFDRFCSAPGPSIPPESLAEAFGIGGGRS